MKKVEKWAALMVCAMSLVFASEVVAVPITLALDDAYYLGSIKPGLKPNEENQQKWINEIVGLAVGEIKILPKVNPGDKVQTIERSSNDFGPLNEIDDVSKRDNANPTWTVTADSLYVLGKYGNSIPGGHASFVWYLGNLEIGTQVILPQSALSHSTMGFGDRPTTSVPDSGSALALLGVAVAGLGFAHRKLR